MRRDIAMNKAERNYLRIAKSATPAQIELAAQWYNDAGIIAEEIATNLNVSLEIGACIIASFSPNQRWGVNVSQALRFSKREKVSAMGMCLKMVNASLINGFNALKGPKTNAFARAIAGDEEAVVIDLWMLRAAGHHIIKIGPAQYKIHAEAVTKVSEKIGITPRTCQALIWIIARSGGQLSLF